MGKRFAIEVTPLPDLLVIERKPIGDERGYLERLWDQAELVELAPGKTFHQINRTFTRDAATIRGLHFQRAPSLETKVVQCLRGRVFDVAVDLRADSPTYGKWHGVELSGSGHRTMVIPEGFAHGLQTLTDDCEMLYFHTAPYDPEAEGGVNPLDPGLAIAWPLPPMGMSARDCSHPPLDDSFERL